MSSLCALPRLPRNLAISPKHTTLSKAYRAASSRPSPSTHHSIHPARHFTTTPSRTMSQFKYEYFVTIPDVPNAPEKRLAARPAHLANLKAKIESGQVVFGGATLSKQPEDGEAPQMTGSAMLIKGNSEEEVREMLMNDEYVKQGAWDISKAVITPFKCAIRTPL